MCWLTGLTGLAGLTWANWASWASSPLLFSRASGIHTGRERSKQTRRQRSSKACQCGRGPGQREETLRGRLGLKTGSGLCNPLRASIGFPLYHLAGYKRSKKVFTARGKQDTFHREKCQDFALKRLDTQYDLTQGINPKQKEVICLLSEIR